MSSFHEIERKYKLSNEPLDSLLEHFEYKGEKRVIDKYFDTCGGEWYQKGIFVRIRNGVSLDIKFNPDHLETSITTEHVSCHEYSFTEPFGKGERRHLETLCKMIELETSSVRCFQSLLTQNGLDPFLTIDKVRQTYTNETFTLVIDTIQGLGKFLEIEYSGSVNHSIEFILEAIDELIKGIDLKPLTCGSFEMILRRDNYDLYRKGKYLLEEDLLPKAS